MKTDFFCNSVRRSTPAYPEAVRIGDFLFCSGITGIDMDKVCYENGNFDIRLRQCFKNLDSILKKSGSSVKNIIRLRVYLRNIRHINLIDNLMPEYFEKPKMPVRTVIEVNRLVEEQDLEMEAVAYSGKTTPVYSAKDNRNYSDVIEVDNYLFCSGDLSTVCEDKSLSFEEEMVNAMETIKNALKKHNSSMKDVYNTYAYVTNMLDRETLNEVYKKYFSLDYPLRVIVEPRNVANNKRVMIECTAYKGERVLLSTTKGQIPTGPFSQGYRIGSYVYCSGVRPIDPETKRLNTGDFSGHVIRCVENLLKILSVENVPIEKVYECKVYMRNLMQLPVVNDVFRNYFPHQLPILTVIEINRLNEDYEKGWEPFHDIEIQFNAYIGS